MKENSSKPTSKTDEVAASSSILDLVASFVGKTQETNAISRESRVDAVALDIALPETANDVTCGDCVPFSGSSSHQGSPAVVKILIFTKDRPWQLEQLFRSMQLEICTQAMLRNLTVHFVVISKVTMDFASHYDKVRTRLEESLNNDNVSLDFIFEDDTADENECDGSFESCLLNIVDVEEESHERYWMFLTDDCAFLVPLWEMLQTSMAAISVTCTQHHGDQSNTLAGANNDTRQKHGFFLSRLHPGVSWCQTRNQPSPPPKHLFCYQALPNHEISPGSNSEGNGVFVYPLDQARGVDRSGEWDYPWDLSGGMYRNDLFQQVLQQLKDSPTCLKHPNQLEIGGNKIMSNWTQSHDFSCIIPPRPFLIVLAINRVQDVFQAPLACSNDQAEGLEPKALLAFMDNGQDLDMDRYRMSTMLDSSHLGMVWLGTDDNETPQTTALSVLIPVRSGPPQASSHALTSIMMQPIEDHRQNRYQRTGCTGGDALSSVLLSPLQIVIVDDRCHDGSVDAMVKTARNLIEEHHIYVSLTVTDHRERSSAIDCQSSHHNKERLKECICIDIEIYSTPRPGISAALNWGLKQCRSDYVARMDADDISVPGRFLAQLETLKSQQHLSVLGTNLLVFRSTSSSVVERQREKQEVVVSSEHIPYSRLSSNQGSNKDSENAQSIIVTPSVYPSSPGFSAWAMLFSCCLAHPSVMFRKHAVEAIGGYDEALTSAEDYDLWLRLIQKDSQCVGCIPMIGLWHRKSVKGAHHFSSNTNVSKQTKESIQACLRTMEEILHVDDVCSDMPMTPISIQTVDALRKPTGASSLDDLDEAAKLLVGLEKAFLHRYSQTLTDREKELILLDCDGRIGELATLTVSKFGSPCPESSFAWKIWAERCPQSTLERIALLCHRG